MNNTPPPTTNSSSTPPENGESGGDTLNKSNSVDTSDEHIKDVNTSDKADELDEILDCQLCSGVGYWHDDEPPHDKVDPCECQKRKAKLSALINKRVREAKIDELKQLRKNSGDLIPSKHIGYRIATLNQQKLE